jgi:acid phosphatase
MADRMAATHSAAPPAAILTVGDNVYENGITSVDDPHWDFVFSSVYRGAFWDEQVFRPTLGNHDARGNSMAQVEMSDRVPRWQMPARFYAFTLPIGTGGGPAAADSVLFVAMDTNLGDLGVRGTEAQRAWLDSLSTAADYRYVISYGHHPVAGGGPRAPRDEVVALAEGFVRESASLHVAGHDHVMQVVQMDGGPLHAICGGGSGTDDPYKIADDQPGQLAGFTGGGWCQIRFWPDTAALELYDAEGTLRHRSLFEPR